MEKAGKSKHVEVELQQSKFISVLSMVRLIIFAYGMYCSALHIYYVEL